MPILLPSLNKKWYDKKSTPPFIIMQAIYVIKETTVQKKARKLLQLQGTNHTTDFQEVCSSWYINNANIILIIFSIVLPLAVPNLNQLLSKQAIVSSISLRLKHVKLRMLFISQIT